MGRRMDKKNIDWANLGFGYQETAKRFVSNYRNGAWDEGGLTSDANIVINECAGVLQYAQTCFEGMKAYTTEDGRIVTFRPDLNAQRMEDTCKRLEMPVFPKERFVVRQCSLCASVWIRRNAVYSSLYVCKLCGDRCETGG